MFTIFLDDPIWGIILAVGIIAAIGLSVLVFFLLGRRKKKKDGKEADGIIKDAKIRAEYLVRDAKQEAQQIIFDARTQAENDARTRRGELAVEENKLALRIQTIDARDAALIEKENNLERKSESLDASIASYKKKLEELDKKIDDILVELEKVAGMSSQ